MPVSAATELEIPKTAEAKNRPVRVPVVTSHESHSAEVREKISKALTKGGFPHTAEQINPEGEPNEVLAKIENGGVAEVTQDLGDRLVKRAENALGMLAGSTRNYTAEGSAGHKIVHGMMSRRAIAAKAAKKYINLLAHRGK